jgi:hypothetical protein
MSQAELANAYAALILADDGIEITVRSLQNPTLNNPTNRTPGRQAHHNHQGRWSD